MNVEFYDTKRRKKILEELNLRFGIINIPKILFQTGKDKVRAFSGDLDIDELYELDRLANIEFMGLYLFKIDLGHLRISFDGTILFNEQVDKNIVELNEEQFYKWIRGNNLELVLDRGIYFVRYNGDVFGCGISDGKGLINFVPKERRIRKG